MKADNKTYYDYGGLSVSKIQLSRAFLAVSVISDTYYVNFVLDR